MIYRKVNNMINIKLIIIGHSDRVVNFDEIKKHKSKFFKFLDIERINHLPNPEKDDGYLDIVYSKTEIQRIMNDIEYDGLCIATMNYGFNDHFYMHRVAANKVCISIYGLENILGKRNISLENFIIKNTYEIFIFHKILKNFTNNEEVYTFIHSDTRGCLFDMNGDKRDIVYNTEKPIICDECKGKINNKSIPKNFLEDIQKELLKIDKPFIKKIENFISKYPLFSVLVTFFFSTLINLFSNWLWEMIK
jgi:6-pyruvoyl-tetrahydropterin synthase